MPNKPSHTQPRARRNDRLLIRLGLSFATLAILGVAVAMFVRLAADAEDGAANDPTALASDGPAEALGARVEFPSSNRGRLPLDTTVTQTYEVVNTGAEPLRLGKPTIEVVEGCCPPIPSVSQQVLGPGETATVAMSMQMHEGMDGPHLFHLTVPVASDSGQDSLHLYFKGDFRGS